MPAMFGDTAATLIVDDDTQIAAVLARILTREGYRCTLASDAQEARQCLAATDFAVALVDVMLPGESGLELVDDMLMAHKSLAAVMVTAVTNVKVAELALDSGVYGYITKPFTVSQVLITVGNASRRRCLEIEGRAYRQRLAHQIAEQKADLDAARAEIEQLHGGTTAG
jgi:two-component system phosphate regulon response regulator OmpR